MTISNLYVLAQKKEAYSASFFVYLNYFFIRIAKHQLDPATPLCEQGICQKTDQS